MRKMLLSRLKTLRLQDVNWKNSGKRLIALLGDGWYYPGDPMSQDRRRLIACNYTSNIIANLIGGTFWTGLLLHLNADDGFIGTMTMISTAVNMLQLFAPLLLERFAQRKKLLILFRTVMYLINVLLIGLIPLFPMAQQSRLTLTALSVLIVNLLSALSAPGINIWHLQSLPNQVRKPYFSLLTMTNGAVIAIALLLGGKVVDLFREWGMEYQGLMALRVISLALCGAELLMYSRIREYPYENGGDKLSLIDLVTQPFKKQHRLYLLTVATVALWTFSANLCGSYHSVYLLKNLGVSYTYLNLVNMMNIPMLLLLTPVWRKLLSRFDWFKTLYIALGLYALRYIALAFVTTETLFIYPIEELFRFVTAIGINLAFTGIPYVNMPKEHQTAFMGFYSTCSNLAALLGVTLGKYFILGTDGYTLSILGFNMVNKQYLMLLTAAVMLPAALGVMLIERKLRSQSR